MERGLEVPWENPGEVKCKSYTKLPKQMEKRSRNQHSQFSFLGLENPPNVFFLVICVVAQHLWTRILINPQTWPIIPILQTN